MASNSNAALRVGDSFASFSEFKSCLDQFEKEQCITYYKRDSRTFEAASRRVTIENPNPDLMYYEIKFTCIKGGKQYKTQSSGQRPNQRSFREACGSFVQLRASKDGQRLVVVKMNTEHNHPVSKEFFLSLPKQRRLDAEEMNEVNNILTTRPNKKVLRDHIRRTTGKMVTLRDLSNHSAKLNPKPGHLGDVFQDLDTSEMATASNLPQDTFVCSICLKVFTEPVSTPCGHNFCFKCIFKYWDNNEVCQCPVCQHQFPARPGLKVNTELVDEFKESGELKSSTTDQSLPEMADVPCDICTETKVRSLKSCLMCLSSFCELHLERHLRVAGLKSHTLIDPVPSFDDKLCTKHNKITELYCRTDQLCICLLCQISEHWSHDVVQLEEEYEAVTVKKDEALASIQEMIQKRSEKIAEIETSVSVSQREADKDKEATVQVFSDLIQSVQRNQAEVMEVIEERNKLTRQKWENFIRELREEITELQRRRAELEKLSQSADRHTFVQNFSILSSPMNNDVASIVVDSSLSFHAVREGLCEMQRSVDDKVEEIPEIKLKNRRKHAVDVTFDPDTAHPRLIISQDGKEVTKVDEEQERPNNPKRFEVYSEVLAKEGFTSGKFYYEVKVSEDDVWTVGVARESVERKKSTNLSVQNGFWCIGLFDTYEAYDETKTELKLKKKIQNVGIFVDYQGGQVSFWDVDSKSHIYTFSSQNFTEKIYPYFFNETDNETLSITPVHP